MRARPNILLSQHKSKPRRSPLLRMRQFYAQAWNPHPLLQTVLHHGTTEFVPGTKYLLRGQNSSLGVQCFVPGSNFLGTEP